MDYPLVLHILSYQHEKLYKLVSKALIAYNDNDSNDASTKLPLSLLVSSQTFRSHVATSPRFRNVMCKRHRRDTWLCFAGCGAR
eukprot:gene248-355_t